MTTQINNYAELQALLNSFVSASGVTPGLAPHKVFWNSLSYEEFTTGDVPGLSSSYKILEIGDAANSNIVQALSGTPGSPFDPNTGSIGQMPQPSPPYDASIPTQTDVIAALSDWIDRKCPN